MPITRSTSAVPLWGGKRVLLYDTFTDANDTQLDAHRPDIGNGSWVRNSAGAPDTYGEGAWIYTNGVCSDGRLSRSDDTFDVGDTQYLLEVEQFTDDAGGVVERFWFYVRWKSVAAAGTGDFYSIGVWPDEIDEIRLNENDGGTQTVRASDGSVTRDGGVTTLWRVRVDNNGIYALDDSNNILLSYESTLHNDSTLIGIRNFGQNSYGSAATSYNYHHIDWLRVTEL